jgi:hypothetical protein
LFSIGDANNNNERHNAVDGVIASPTTVLPAAIAASESSTKRTATPMSPNALQQPFLIPPSTVNSHPLSYCCRSTSGLPSVPSLAFPALSADPSSSAALRHHLMFSIPPSFVTPLPLNSASRPAAAANSQTTVGSASHLSTAGTPTIIVRPEPILASATKMASFPVCCRQLFVDPAPGANRLNSDNNDGVEESANDDATDVSKLVASRRNPDFTLRPSSRTPSVFRDVNEDLSGCSDDGSSSCCVDVDTVDDDRDSATCDAAGKSLPCRCET